MFKREPRERRCKVRCPSGAMVLVDGDIREVYREFGALPHFVRTSIDGEDEAHGERSRHQTGDAIDYRLPPDPDLARVIVDTVRRRVAWDYDVVHHASSGHMHVEFDPRRD